MYIIIINLEDSDIATEQSNVLWLCFGQVWITFGEECKENEHYR